jgi:ATP-dependent protease ClpP protease subunit
MARTIRENLDSWFDLNLDVDGRFIYMGSVGKDYSENETGVDNFMAEYFIKGMHILENRSDKPITVIMNNPGGDVYHGFAIYDSIKTSNCHCTIKVFGHAMSMGSIILQAADHRIMLPNSRFMIHYGYNGQNNHTKIFEKWSDEGKKLNYQMENIYIDRMIDKEKSVGSGTISNALYNILRDQKQFDYPVKEVKKPEFSTDLQIMREELRDYVKELLNYDTILTPEETVSIGLADEVLQNN